MNAQDIIRAWKDPQYREILGDEAPEHPAGVIELTDEELGTVYSAGGSSSGRNLRFSSPTKKKQNGGNGSRNFRTPRQRNSVSKGGSSYGRRRSWR